jgi:hypothetical protein
MDVKVITKDSITLIRDVIEVIKVTDGLSADNDSFIIMDNFRQKADFSQEDITVIFLIKGKVMAVERQPYKIWEKFSNLIGAYEGDKCISG